jgi:CheY-like chemotaxis protein
LIKILIVDDDPSTRFVLRLILEREGYEVLEAAHGEAALEMMGPDSLPDIVTTDLMMPILNGTELIARLRAEPRTASIPIVVVSSNAEAARSLKASGMVDAIIGKPFDAVRLASDIRAIAGNPIRGRQQSIQGLV